jgi:tetratricopeptide (TPR) repeat protein
LREGVSQREKLAIAALYDTVVTRDFEAARKSYLIWTQTYPNDARAMTNLGTVYTYLGEYAESLAAHQKALKLNPGAGSNYPNLVIAYTHTNQLGDARAVGQEATAHNLDSVAIHGDLYLVDFLQHDAAGMAREAALAAQPGWEDVILYYQSDTAAYGGQFALARQLTRRAADAAARSDKKEAMAAYEAEAAMRDALIGNSTLAKQQAAGAPTLSTGRDVTAMSALASHWRVILRGLQVWLMISTNDSRRIRLCGLICCLRSEQALRSTAAKRIRLSRHLRRAPGTRWHKPRRT